jgi:hypothetical protein
MSTRKKSLFADAITDAKELKETALASAKAALAESFAPKVSSMISNKLNEMEDEMDDERSLEEILNEMGEEDEFIEDPEMGMEDELNSEDEFAEPEMGEEVEEEVVDLTVEELKDVIRDVMMELEGEEDPEMEDDTIQMTPEDEEEELDMVAEDFNLDEILSEMGGGSMQEPSDAAAAGLDNLIAMIKSTIAKAPEALNKITQALEDAGSAAGSSMRSESSLFEVKKLKRQLSEVNLLNAKLIYVNKVFKATNLSEVKKVAIINAFDRATNVKEVQNTFKTIKESVLTAPSKPLRENRGSASRALGISNREIITESKTDTFVERMQKLAGIKL